MDFLVDAAVFMENIIVEDFITLYFKGDKEEQPALFPSRAPKVNAMMLIFSLILIISAVFGADFGAD